MCGTWEPVALMLREKFKWWSHKSESTDAGHRGGTTRSSNEVSVMEMERRGCIVQSYRLVNQIENRYIGMNRMSKTKPLIWLDDKSRMNREVHVRFCEGVGVKFPCATRRFQGSGEILANLKIQILKLSFCFFGKKIIHFKSSFF